MIANILKYVLVAITVGATFLLFSSTPHGLEPTALKQFNLSQ